MGRVYSDPHGPPKAGLLDLEEAPDLREEGALSRLEAGAPRLVRKAFSDGGQLDLAAGEDVRDLLRESGAGRQDPLERLLRHAPALDVLQRDDGGVPRLPQQE